MIVGIDYSITSPSICIFEGEPKKFSLKNCTFHSLSEHKLEDTFPFFFHLHKKEYGNQIERFIQIAEWATGLIPSNTDLIGIEDYSMGSKGKVFNIAENCGILKYLLFTKGISFKTVAPTVVKKYATGKGNATKDKMVEQFFSDTGIDLKGMLQPKRKLGSPTTDIVDSFYICGYFVDN